MNQTLILPLQNVVADKATKKKKKQASKEPEIEQRLASHFLEVGVGECGVYSRGDAEIAYCVESLNDFHKDIKKVRS